MKLVNNMLSAANLAAACEVMAVGAKAGHSGRRDARRDEQRHRQNSATLTKVPNNIATRAFDCGSSLHNVLKDLTAYLDEAREAGIAGRIE
jgi:3-hydroxyisobutyrate dehydrogenase-like beta-hydroxyacid dehydrogenase